MGMVKTIRIDVTTSEDLWPYQVVGVIQKVMEENESKYPDRPWKEQSTDEHLKHAKEHIRDFQKGGLHKDEHLAHAFTRLMMAVAIRGKYADVEEDEFAKRDREAEEKIRKGEG